MVKQCEGRMKDRRRSKWSTVHSALDVISQYVYVMGFNSSYTRDYDVSDTLNKRQPRVNSAKYTGFTMKNRNK